ncbi:MAG: AMP-binding protein, partial [Gammaproteobacteria bacterium]|nr:AMP-binding protein [Gammaproteobacteria bacterium]
MSRIYPVREPFSSHAHVTRERYEQLYAQSISDNEGFWREQAARLDWLKGPEQIRDVSYALEDFRIRWYADGELNVCANCVDRHLPHKADDTAIIWEGDDPSRDARITYRELHERVCRFANVLKARGIGKGDRVTIYMPMIPEAAIAMLACARIGAVHSVVFGGFSPDALAGRIIDCESRAVITADEGVRGGRRIPLKANVDAALEVPGAQIVSEVIVVRNTGGKVAWHAPRDT